MPPVSPPARKAAPVDTIGVNGLSGITRPMTIPTKEPAPIPLTTSPIIPVFKLVPIFNPPLLRLLEYRLVRFIDLVLGVLVFIVADFRCLVDAFRCFLGFPGADFRLVLRLFIATSFRVAAFCFAVRFFKISYRRYMCLVLNLVDCRQ